MLVPNSIILEIEVKKLKIEFDIELNPYHRHQSDGWEGSYLATISVIEAGQLS